MQASATDVFEPKNARAFAVKKGRWCLWDLRKLPLRTSTATGLSPNGSISPSKNWQMGVVSAFIQVNMRAQRLLGKLQTTPRQSVIGLWHLPMVQPKTGTAETYSVQLCAPAQLWRRLHNCSMSKTEWHSH